MIYKNSLYIAICLYIKELELLGMDDKFDLMYNVEAAQKLTEMELKADGIKEGIE